MTEKHKWENSDDLIDKVIEEKAVELYEKYFSDFLYVCTWYDSESEKGVGMLIAEKGPDIETVKKKAFKVFSELNGLFHSVQFPPENFNLDMQFDDNTFQVGFIQYLNIPN